MQLFAVRIGDAERRISDHDHYFSNCALECCRGFIFADDFGEQPGRAVPENTDRPTRGCGLRGEPDFDDADGAGRTNRNLRAQRVFGGGIIQQCDRAVVPQSIRETQQFAALCPASADVLVKRLPA